MGLERRESERGRDESQINRQMKTQRDPRAEPREPREFTAKNGRIT